MEQRSAKSVSEVYLLFALCFVFLQHTVLAGRNDFDNIPNLGDVIKTIISEKAMDQAADVKHFGIFLSSIKVTYDNGTITKTIFQEENTLRLNSTGGNVHFLFNVSGSDKKPNFNFSIKFGDTLKEKVEISLDGARPDDPPFRPTYKPEPFTGYSTKKDVYEALDRIFYMDYSRCGLGLENVAKPERARVVIGNKALEPWPWMAALYITDSRTEDHELKCGGSIIGQQWILTAAHCLCKVYSSVLRPTYQILIKLGLTDVKNSTYLQNFEASEFFVHEAYNPLNHDNDIALIKLNGIVEYNAYVRPICLPHDVIPEDSPLYKVDEFAFAAGWGYDQNVRDGQKVRGRTQSHLKELLVPLQPRERCLHSILSSGETRNLFTDQMLCAGNGDGTGDTCFGDSGGPLMQYQLNKEKNVFWTQVGLVSWGIGCNQLDHYGFYVHVHKLLPWIKNIMKNGE